MGLVIVLVFFFVAFPFVLVGAPTSLFMIANHDTVDHKVTIEILAPNNESFLKEQYTIKSSEYISEEKPTLMVFRTLFKGNERGYLVVTTLDDNSSASLEIAYHPWNEPMIIINDNEISIVEMTV
jgi:hypothetical protein